MGGTKLAQGFAGVFKMRQARSEVSAIRFGLFSSMWNSPKGGFPNAHCMVSSLSPLEKQHVGTGQPRFITLTDTGSSTTDIRGSGTAS